MKSLQFSRWLVWGPTTAVMRRLRFPAKMGLVSVAFVVPLLWLLGHYLVVERGHLDFVEQERHGVAYVRAVYRSVQAANAWGAAVHPAAAGRGSPDAPAARQQFMAALAALRGLHDQHGERWALSPAWSRLEAAVAQAEKAAPAETPAQAGGQRAIALALGQLLSAATDQSGLALDPEMATYYLMSAALMHGPHVIRSTAELRDLGSEALRSERIEAAQALRLAALQTVIEHELAGAEADLAKARAAAGDGVLAPVTGAIEASRGFMQLVKTGFPLDGQAIQGDVNAFVGTANATLTAQHAQVEKNLGVLDELLARRQAQIHRGLSISLGITGLCLVMAALLAMGFYRAMHGGFKALRRHLMAISMGDLRAEIHGQGHDEISDLLREVGHMQSALRLTVQQVQTASNAVVTSSMEIAAGTMDLSSRTEAAAAALEESAAALEQTTSSVSQTADSARQASEIAVDNARVAEHGGSVMQQVVQTMERIQTSSRKINDIISVIDGIAFQTNILALNAAVEAARAGEQGRGFAVVAGEVRSLARRSSEAAREIRGLISVSVSDVDGGMGVVRQAGDTMREIVGNADQVRQLLDAVANGAREQSVGVDQIGVAVQDLDRSTQANAALVEQTATAAQRQRQAAVQMAAQVDEFRLPRGAGHVPALTEGIDVDAIIDAHRQWKVKLREAIEHRAKVDTATLCRDDCCALGQWIYGDGQRLAGRASFTELIARHKKFHQVAATVGELINQSRYRQAEEALVAGTPFSQATSDVAMVLSSAKRLGF